MATPSSSREETMATPTTEVTTSPPLDAKPPTEVPNLPSSRLDRTRVLVAVDESEESLKALSWSIDNLFLPPGCTRCSDVIILLHVQSHPQVLVGPVGPGKYYSISLY